MKKLLLLALTAATFAACDKDSKSTKPLPNPNAMKYTVNGIADKELMRRDSVFIPITVAYTSGNQERLSISVEGLPPGVTAKITPANGTPDFDAFLMLKAAKDASIGEQIITIKTTTPLGANKSFDMALNIKPVTNCSPFVTGQYLGQYDCTITGSTTTSMFVFQTDTPGLVRMNFFPFNGSSISNTIKAFVDCENDMVTIPQQTQSGYTISGSGPFTDTSMTINYTITDPAAQTGNCSAHFSKF